MENELRRLRAQLADAERRRDEEQRGREEEQRRREDAERRRDEEQRRREEADRAASAAIDQNLTRFLEGCHQLSMNIKAVTESSASTRGTTSNPTHRLFPQRILPWPDFATRQHDFWSHAAASAPLWTERVYPSATNLDFAARQMDPIGSEDDLRFIQRLTVENMVQRVLDRVGANNQLNEIFRSYNTISFENQASFRAEELGSIDHAMQGLSVDTQRTQPPRNSRADQFCVVRSRDGIARPVVAIEYKAPHKLTMEEICRGLESEIWPERDVIDQSRDDFTFLCRNLMAAVITQLFSYMIDRGVRYGYISTGEAFIFLRIPEDPAIVYYSVNIPNRDCAYDQENRLQRTAVSQVVAFIQQALQDEQPSQAWIQSARSQLKRWKVEFIDVLQTIPETLRKTRDASVYQPSPWLLNTERSPIILRSRCKPQDMALQEDENDRDGSDGDENIQSPTQRIQTRSRTAAVRRAQTSGEQEEQRSRGQPSQRTSHELVAIEKRPYCTHECLLGLTAGHPLDPLCPNLLLHGQSHLGRTNFLDLLSSQLASNHGQDAGCCALYIHGARGALLKVCLTTHGYTLVAKGVETTNRRYLVNEAKIYDRLGPIQGRHVPACCGLIDLRLPFHYDGVELKHVLLMSWAGKSLVALTREGANSKLLEQCIKSSTTALTAIHSREVLHRDAEPRNIMYDEVAGTTFIVDFECSEYRGSSSGRQILGELSPNRKRKHACTSQAKNAGQEDFGKELRWLEYHMRKTVQSV